MSVSSMFRSAVTRRSAFVLIGILALFGTNCRDAAFGQNPTDDSASYDLHRHYKAHEVERYKAEVTVTTNGPQSGGKNESVKYSFVIREIVTANPAAGTSTLVLQYEKAVTSNDRESMDLTAKMPIVTQVTDNAGNVQTSIEGGTDSLAKMPVKMMAMVLQAEAAGKPEKPVRAGDIWPLESPNPADPNTTWAGKAGLIAVEEVNGDKAAKINYVTDTSTAGVDTSRTHTDATLRLDTLSGRTLQFDFKTIADTGDLKTTVEIHDNNIDSRPALVAIQRTYKAGEVDRYMLYSVSTTKLPDGADHVVKLELIVRKTVSEAGEANSATVVYESERARRSVDNGDIVDITASMPKVTQVRSDQHSFQVKVEGGDAQLRNPVLNLFMQTIQAQIDVMPPKQARVGDSWNYKGTTRENTTRTGTATANSVETVKGVRQVKLNCTTETASDGPPAVKGHSEATSLVDMATGKTISLSTKVTSLVGVDKTTAEISFSPVEAAADGTNNGK